MQTALPLWLKAVCEDARPRLSLTVQAGLSSDAQAVVSASSNDLVSIAALVLPGALDSTKFLAVVDFLRLTAF